MAAKVVQPRELGVLHACSGTGSCDRGKVLCHAARMREEVEAMLCLRGNIDWVDCPGIACSRIAGDRVSVLNSFRLKMIDIWNTVQAWPMWMRSL